LTKLVDAKKRLDLTLGDTADLPFPFENWESILYRAVIQRVSEMQHYADDHRGPIFDYTQFITTYLRQTGEILHKRAEPIFDKEEEFYSYFPIHPATFMKFDVVESHFTREDHLLREASGRKPTADSPRGAKTKTRAQGSPTRAGPSSAGAGPSSAGPSKGTRSKKPEKAPPSKAPLPSRRPTQAAKEPKQPTPPSRSSPRIRNKKAVATKKKPTSKELVELSESSDSDHQGGQETVATPAADVNIIVSLESMERGTVPTNGKKAAKKADAAVHEESSSEEEAPTKRTEKSFAERAVTESTAGPRVRAAATLLQRTVHNPNVITRGAMSEAVKAAIDSTIFTQQEEQRKKLAQAKVAEKVNAAEQAGNLPGTFNPPPGLSAPVTTSATASTSTASTSSSAPAPRPSPTIVRQPGSQRNLMHYHLPKYARFPALPSYTAFEPLYQGGYTGPRLSRNDDLRPLGLPLASLWEGGTQVTTFRLHQCGGRTFVVPTTYDANAHLFATFSEVQASLTPPAVQGMDAHSQTVYGPTPRPPSKGPAPKD
jgi:hypothetical protein